MLENNFRFFFLKNDIPIYIFHSTLLLFLVIQYVRNTTQCETESRKIENLKFVTSIKD